MSVYIFNQSESGTGRIWSPFRLPRRSGRSDGVDQSSVCTSPKPGGGKEAAPRSNACLQRPARAWGAVFMRHVLRNNTWKWGVSAVPGLQTWQDTRKRKNKQTWPHTLLGGGRCFQKQFLFGGIKYG